MPLYYLFHDCQPETGTGRSNRSFVSLEEVKHLLTIFRFSSFTLTETYLSLIEMVQAPYEQEVGNREMEYPLNSLIPKSPQSLNYWPLIYHPNGVPLCDLNHFVADPAHGEIINPG